MKMIPADIVKQFSDILKKRAVPVSLHVDYRKWLRYFLDFEARGAIFLNLDFLLCKNKIQSSRPGPTGSSHVFRKNGADV